jgi:hypothetical protein
MRSLDMILFPETTVLEMSVTRREIVLQC